MSRKKKKGVDSPMPTTLRELVESFGMAILMAIGLKYFLIEAYSIPSPSMQPTLLGSTTAGVYDRILVDKAAYLLREPRRWEIAVFRYPHNRSQNYVKRIVGLPGETLQILGGDIYQRTAANELEVVRKPQNLQSAFWREIWRSEDGEDRDFPISGGSLQRDGGIELESTRSGSRATLALGDAGSYRDNYWHGYPAQIRESIVREGGGPQNARGIESTGDLRIGFDLALRGDWKNLSLRIEEETESKKLRTLRLLLRNDGGKTTAQLAAEGAGLTDSVASKAVPIASTSSVRVEFWNWDDQLWGRIGSQELGPLTYDAVAEPLSREEGVRVRLALAGGSAGLQNVVVARDQYYDGGQAQGADIAIPEDTYWMLGDNTKNSDDGRSWRILKLSYDSDTNALTAPGKGDATLEGNARVNSHDADENPVFVSKERGPLVFSDLQGEEHVLDASFAEFERLGYMDGAVHGEGKPQRFARFVPREYFLGRALAIFWPIGLGGPFRPSWIR